MDISVTISQKQFTVFQIVSSTIIILLGLGAYLFEHFTGHASLMGFLWLFNVESEQSIPTYYSVINLLLASILLIVVYFYERNMQSKHSKYWLFLSLLFVFLSMDESASIHEKFQLVHNSLVTKGYIPPLLESHQWLPFGVLFVVIIGFIMLPFLKKLPNRTRTLFLLSAFIFLAGALGFEYLGSWMLSNDIVGDKSEFIYKIRRIFEEGFEIYGIVLFNITLFHELLLRSINLNISLNSDRSIDSKL